MTTAAEQPDWKFAACRDTTVDMFPTTVGGIAAAKAVCADCQIRPDCLAWAVDSGEQHGVWGGMGESERPTRTQLRRLQQRQRPMTVKCERCGLELTARQRQGRQRFCSRECAGIGRNPLLKDRSDLIEWVAAQPGPVPTQEIADRMGMTRQGCREALMRLVAAGLLSSELVVSDDGRRVRYFTTTENTATAS